MKVKGHDSDKLNKFVDQVANLHWNYPYTKLKWIKKKPSRLVDDINNYRVYNVVDNIRNRILNKERFIEQGKMLVEHLGNIEKMVLKSGG